MKTSDQHTSSLALYIGKPVFLRCEYLLVDVTIVDAKRSYGRTLLLVRPVSRSGEQWVEESRVTGIEDEPFDSRSYLRSLGNGGGSPFAKLTLVQIRNRLYVVAE
jgi:hypothetical protein